MTLPEKKTAGLVLQPPSHLHSASMGKEVLHSRAEHDVPRWLIEICLRRHSSGLFINLYIELFDHKGLFYRKALFWQCLQHGILTNPKARSTKNPCHISGLKKQCHALTCPHDEPWCSVLGVHCAWHVGIVCPPQMEVEVTIRLVGEEAENRF